LLGELRSCFFKADESKMVNCGSVPAAELNGIINHPVAKVGYIVNIDF
jgi:hypothetical protein